MKKLKNAADCHTITEFKKTYPEVYDWFQGEYFAEQIIDKKEVSIRIYRILDRLGGKEYALGLPIQDSNGVVDMEDVVEYLKAEGLIAGINSEYVDTKDLFIRLK